jgi:hypothetical protein
MTYLITGMTENKNKNKLVYIKVSFFNTNHFLIIYTSYNSLEGYFHVISSKINRNIP